MPQPKINPFIQQLRHRCDNEGGLFWLDEEQKKLAAFDPVIAKQINADNFADLTLPDRLKDQLKGQKSCPFSWGEIKDAWFKQMHTHSQPDQLEQLTTGMTELIDARLNQPLDLVLAAQDIFSQALLPTMIANLPDRQFKRIQTDQRLKIKPFTIENPPEPSLFAAIHSTIVQIRAASVVRRELNFRAKGKRPRQQDILDPIVDMLPRLGIDRAVDTVTMILTAIGGPPGAAASCLLYELCLRPHWKQTLSEELGNIALHELLKAPTKVAPITWRFIKEILRMWSPPIIASRQVRTDINFQIKTQQHQLAEGQLYLLSPYMIHHDPQHWPDPDTFDPDRWLPDSDKAAKTRGSYIPFGWAPKTCIGQTLGTYQLIILSWLMCTKYDITLDDPTNVGMTLAAMPLPLNFSGVISNKKSRT
ncbi:MAG: cytochrome P450 [Phenylobacterium sp.]|jgi:cytochrome P450